MTQQAGSYATRARRLEALLKKAYPHIPEAIRRDIEAEIPELAPQPSPRPWRFTGSNLRDARGDLVASNLRRVDGEHIAKLINLNGELISHEYRLTQQLRALANGVLTIDGNNWNASWQVADVVGLAKGAKKLLQEVGDE